MSTRAVEKYYAIAEVALLLSLSTKTVMAKMLAGDFGDGVVNLGSDKPGGADYRLPASGVNAWLERRRVFSADVAPVPGIAARNIAELRRKARVFSELAKLGEAQV